MKSDHTNNQQERTFQAFQSRREEREQLVGLWGVGEMDMYLAKIKKKL